MWMSEEEKKTKKRKSPMKFLITAAFFLALGGLIAGGAVYSLARQYPDVLGIATMVTEEEERKKILLAVSKIMDIPKDETPTITTISESDKENPESYFKNGKTGDKVIAYTKSKRVILYRPSENKIMDIGFMSASASASPTPAALSKSMSIFIFNGTDTVGATRSIEAKLESIYTNFKISGRGVASKTDYPETLVVDLAGNRSEDVKKIAFDLGISVGALPEGEKAPEDSDFLVIVGSNNLTASPSATVAPSTPN